MKKIHLIGNAHIDPAWLWRWQEGFAEIKATFRSALDRMNEFGNFVFTCAGAAHYAWIEENAPEMFQEIRRRVEEGRRVLAGGWWVQADCNIPCGESLARSDPLRLPVRHEAAGAAGQAAGRRGAGGGGGFPPDALLWRGQSRGRADGCHAEGH